MRRTRLLPIYSYVVRAYLVGCKLGLRGRDEEVRQMGCEEGEVADLVVGLAAWAEAKRKPALVAKMRAAAITGKERELRR